MVSYPVSAASSSFSRRSYCCSCSLDSWKDTGYMARVAFLMDRIMRHLGLHGRAFVPMLSGFACAVPAVLATRTMERQRDRFLTMMVIPLMTCSARLPVYTLVIAALFPPTKLFGVAPVQGLLMMAMYLFSTVIALVAAAILSRTVFKGVSVPLILEMPPYRRPHVRSVLRMMWMRSSMFSPGSRRRHPGLYHRAVGPPVLSATSCPQHQL